MLDGRRQAAEHALEAERATHAALSARRGDLENTGENDGPTEAEFWFVEAEDEIDPDSDQPRERR